MKCFLLTLLLAVSSVGFAQDYFYLEDIRLKKDADFTDNEAEVIKAVDYLMSTSVDESNMNRKACTRFIIRYAEKSPFITMTLDGSLIKVYKGNSDLLQLFMGLWLKSAINNKNETEAFHEEYIYTQLSEYCAKGNGIVKTEVIESLITAGQNGDIPNWIVNLKK